MFDCRCRYRRMTIARAGAGGAATEEGPAFFSLLSIPLLLCLPEPFLTLGVCEHYGGGPAAVQMLLQHWKIETDTPKEYMKNSAVKLGTNFRSRLATKYIYEPSPNPDAQKAYKKYPFIDEEDWKSFVKQKTSEESMAKREKSKASSSMKKNTATVGQEGYIGLKRKQCDIWPQLEENYPELKGIENQRSRLFIMGHAIKDKKTKLYSLDNDGIEKAHNLCQAEKNMIEDKSYYENNEDQLVKVVGREHGGRSRKVSNIIGYTRVHGGLFKNTSNGGNSVQQGDTCSDGPVNYPPIMNETQCELLINVGDSLVKVAEGKAWPTMGAILHFKPIPVDCVKVSVDGIVDLYKDLARTFPHAQRLRALWRWTGRCSNASGG